MTQEYKGFNNNIAQRYLEGETIEFISKEQQAENWGASSKWQDVIPYRVPSDIRRVSCEEFTFRVKPHLETLKFWVNKETASTLFLKNLNTSRKPNLELTYDGDTLISAKVI